MIHISGGSIPFCLLRNFMLCLPTIIILIIAWYFLAVWQNELIEGVEAVEVEL